MAPVVVDGVEGLAEDQEGEVAVAPGLGKASTESSAEPLGPPNGGKRKGARRVEGKRTRKDEAKAKSGVRENAAENEVLDIIVDPPSVVEAAAEAARLRRLLVPGGGVEPVQEQAQAAHQEPASRLEPLPDRDLAPEPAEDQVPRTEAAKAAQPVPPILVPWRGAAAAKANVLLQVLLGPNLSLAPKQVRIGDRSRHRQARSFQGGGLLRHKKVKLNLHGHRGGGVVGRCGNAPLLRDAPRKAASRRMAVQSSVRRQ